MQLQVLHVLEDFVSEVEGEQYAQVGAQISSFLGLESGRILYPCRFASIPSRPSLLHCVHRSTERLHRRPFASLTLLFL